MTDYQLSKLFFDLKDRALQAEFKADRKAVMDRYGIGPEGQAAVLADDVQALGARVNAYLLRFYFGFLGWDDASFIAGLRKKKEAVHG